MVRIILNGCNGAMGQAVSELALGRDDVCIAAGIDINTEVKNDYPVFHDLDSCDVPADVIVDFSSAGAVDGLLDHCEKEHIPVVLCSTGLTDEQTARISRTAEKTAVLRSANMSLGVNLLLELVRQAAAVLAPADFDIEIVEKHHNRKKDAPSGTAIALADAINDEMGGCYHYEYDRSDRYESRDKSEIGISSVRGGTIVGEHEVIFAGSDEVVTISHTAYSRSIFAKGALQAAIFLSDKETGLYSMSDVIAKN